MHGVRKLSDRARRMTVKFTDKIGLKSILKSDEDHRNDDFGRPSREPDSLRQLSIFVDTKLQVFYCKVLQKSVQIKPCSNFKHKFEPVFGSKNGL